MSAHELQGIIEQQIESAQKLVDLLERERTALEGKDPDLIASVVSEKQTLLTALSQLEIERERMLASLGIDNTPEAFEQYIQQSGSGNQLSSRLEELKTVLDSCFQMNRVNGGIAELSYHYLSHSLAILRGGEGQNETTYDTHGKTSGSGDAQRTLAKA